VALRGTFEETDPEDVLQILAIGGRTGTLSVRDQGHSTKIVFQNGRIIDAFDGFQRGEDAVFAVLVSRMGSFGFVQEAVPPDQTIERTVPAILLSATQRLDDLRRAKDVLRGPMSRPYPLQTDPSKSELSTETAALLKLVNGKRTLGEIVGMVDQSLEQAYARLAGLVDSGLIGIAVAEDSQPPLSADDDAPGDEPRAIPKVQPIAGRAPTASELREIAEFLRRAIAS